MAIQVVSGASNTILTIDATSNAARMTPYNTAGTAMSDQSSQGNVLNALNNAVTVTLGGQGTFAVDVESTSATITLSFEYTIDNSHWNALSMTPVAGGSPVTSVTGNGQWVGSCAGFFAVRARVSAVSGGAMTVSVSVGPAQAKQIAQAITVAGSLSTTITDNSSDGPAAVKPASTAAVAADPALVVALSPNSPTPVAADNIAAGNITTLGGAVTWGTQGYSGQVIQISGTWTGTLSFQFSVDGGTTWWADTLQTGAGGFASSTTANGIFINLGIGGYGKYRVVSTGGAFTGTANVAWDAGTGNVIIGAQALISDGSNNGPAAVKPASTVALATDPSLVVALSQNTPFAQKDRSSMTAGTQIGIPHIGQAYGVGRIIRVQRTGHVNPSYQTLMALDPIEGSTINSWLWTQSTSTMTITQTTGILTLNANSTTTSGTFAVLTTNKQFEWVNQAPIGCSFKANISQTTNAVNELGFGAPSGATATVNNGAFFRINSSGAIFAVISNAGTETVSASLGTINANNYYLFYVWIEDGGARFIIEDSSGVPIVDYMAQLPLTTPDILSSVSHIPSFARVYNSGTAGAAPQTKITNFQAWMLDIDAGMQISDQLGVSGRYSNIDPTTFAQTLQLAAAAGPSTAAPTATAVKYTTLGGEYINTMTATSESFLGVFGYTVPSPYTLNITDIIMPPPSITTAFTTTATYMLWAMQIANSTNPSTATGPRFPLGSFSALASAAAGTTLSGAGYSQSFRTPIPVMPGQVVMIMVKNALGAATGVYRGHIHINGYFT